MDGRVIHSRVSSQFGAFADKLTAVNGYVDVDSLNTLSMKSKHFRFHGAGNDLHVRILGSMDVGVSWDATPAVAEFTVAAGADVSKEVDAFWTALKVQVKPAVADTHGTLSTKWAGASF